MLVIILRRYHLILIIIHPYHLFVRIVHCYHFLLLILYHLHLIIICHLYLIIVVVNHSQGMPSRTESEAFDSISASPSPIIIDCNDDGKVNEDGSIVESCNTFGSYFLIIPFFSLQ